MIKIKASASRWSSINFPLFSTCPSSQVRNVFHIKLRRVRYRDEHKEETGCTHERASHRHKPSHPYDAGIEHDEFSPDQRMSGKGGGIYSK